MNQSHINELQKSNKKKYSTSTSSTVELLSERLKKDEDHHHHHHHHHHDIEGSDKKMLKFKTPGHAGDSKKGGYRDYTPSPDRSSMYEGRTRRTIRPFSHLNQEEYEITK
mmetsp:Transcript_3328/g.2881  ORF Transcript_3328/g.2881 Transcript_3328/m.2881 type:complete len:110 (-) Transcript_3328:690-1019(-)